MITAEKCMKLLKETKEIQVPEGRFLGGLSENIRKKPRGLKASLAALAEFIDQHQPMESIDANKALLARMRGEDGMDISSLMSDLAIAQATGEDTAAPLAKVQSALTIGFHKQNVFEEILRVVKTIALEHHIEVKDSRAQLRGDEPNKPKGFEDKANEGTWRESIKGDKEKNIPDADITKSAKDGGDQGVDDKAIRKSADEGNTFVPQKNEYEKLESGNADKEHFQALADNHREISQYVDMTEKLLEKYFNIMGRDNQLQ